MVKGLIHIYCGDGKGKTTAAVGLAVRAAGSGEDVVFTQFMKDGNSSEIESLKRILNIEYKCCEGKMGFFSTLNEKEKEDFILAQNSLFLYVKEKINELAAKDGGLVVMDEATYLLNYDIIEKDLFLELIKNKPQNIELVITGRDPKPELLAEADYISEIQCKKHPFSNGIAARRGIEY